MDNRVFNCVFHAVIECARSFGLITRGVLILKSVVRQEQYMFICPNSCMYPSLFSFICVYINIYERRLYKHKDIVI